MQIRSILLVEDSEDDAFLFTHTFQSCGLQAKLHHELDGSLAIDFLSRAWSSGALPRMIFLDLKMPVLNGFDVLKWLQEQPFSSQVTVCVLSGSEQQKDKERAAQLGASEYFVKPMKQADLIRLIAGQSSETKKSASPQTGVQI